MTTHEWLGRVIQGEKPSEPPSDLSDARVADVSIYHACLEMQDRGEPIDLVTMANKLERYGILVDVGGCCYLVSLVDDIHP
jgi:hypothetical protein